MSSTKGTDLPKPRRKVRGTGDIGQKDKPAPPSKSPGIGDVGRRMKRLVIDVAHRKKS